MIGQRHGKSIEESKQMNEDTHDIDPRPGTRPLSETVLSALGITLDEMTAERAVASLTIDSRHHQPFGYLHGGVSVLLAETCASIGASLAAGPEFRVFGMEINANHLRPMREGRITCTGEPLHVGRTAQVWQMDIVDEQGRLVCVSRCTLAVRPI